MKKFVRTLDFYEYDGGDVVVESGETMFLQNEENNNRTISKTKEDRVVNRSGK